LVTAADLTNEAGLLVSKLADFGIEAGSPRSIRPV